ncbi:MAG: class I ribonucleotide reductase maintenance protein YfaE [Francisellaceae bacterium]
MMHIELEQKRYLVVDNNASILENLERSGKAMNHQCREGYCGSCRMRLIRGECHYLKQPLGTMSEDEVLICIAQAYTDITVEKI